MMSAVDVREFQLLETVELGAPVGLQFADELTGRIIDDGLAVRASLATVPERRLTQVEVASSPSGVFQLRHLPGRRAVELGVPSSSTPPRVLVDIVDVQARFLPFRLEVNGATSGLLRWTDEQGRPAPFPLLSAPSRPAPAGVAVMRAQVHESLGGGDIGQPAAWAVVEAWFGSRRLGRGAADERGCLTLMLPYPDALSDPLGSPPGVLLALDEQEWSIELRAKYGEAGSPPIHLRDEPSPHLEALLSQPSAVLWADAQHTQPLTHVALHFGRELIVTTHSAGGRLLLSPTP